VDSTQWDEKYLTQDLVGPDRPNFWIEAEAADLTPGRALDLGCGQGRNAIWLAGLGWRVTAVDFSSVALGHAIRFVDSLPDERAGLIEWVDADLTQFVPEEQSADLVLLSYIHLPPAERHLLVSHAAAALAPGGTLLVIGHDSSNIEHGHGGPQDPLVLFTAEDIVRDLATAGSTVRVEKSGQVRRDVEGADRQAIDAVVRAISLGE
jgi:SAM-dependent methyltransferase